MKFIPHIVGALLGLGFVAFSVMFFTMPPQPAPAADAPAPAVWSHLMMTSGYMAFVKVFELVGGILTAIPKTRNVGLVLLGPILVNIIAFHVFFTGGSDLAIPLVLTAMHVYLVWANRRDFARIFPWGAQA